MQARLIQLGVGVLIVADSAVVALQGRADDGTETLAAVLDQMDGGPRGVPAALAAPFHFGLLPPTGRKNPAVKPGACDGVAIGVDVGDGFDLVIHPGVAARRLAEAIAEVGDLPGREAADDGFDVIDLNFELGHLAPLLDLTDAVQYNMNGHVVKYKILMTKHIHYPKQKIFTAETWRHREEN